LLDDYNDAQYLYELFQDDQYWKKANSTLVKLKRKWKKAYGVEKSPE
jgi:hypothetical protein